MLFFKEETYLNLICTILQMCTWPAISLVVPQSILGLAMSLTVSIHMAGNGVCNLVIGWILGTTSRYKELHNKVLVLYLIFINLYSFFTFFFLVKLRFHYGVGRG